MSLVVDCMTHGVQYLALRMYVPALCLRNRSRMYGTEQHISKALTYGLGVKYLYCSVGTGKQAGYDKSSPLTGLRLNSIAVALSSPVVATDATVIAG